MRHNPQNRIWSGWIILGSIVVAALLVGLFAGAVLLWIPQPVSQAPEPAFTVIPAPTETLTPEPVFSTPTPTMQPEIGESGIGIGVFVQISGTGGEGLRLRSGAGTSHPHRFIGMDAEVFAVKDGPVSSDGFTWWYLEAPYDSSRSGWAAGEYLSVVATDGE